MMKIVKVVLMAGVSLLATMTAAFADPISIGVAVGGWLFTNTFLGGIFGLGTLITASQIALTAAAVAGSLLGRPDIDRGSVDPGQYRSTFESGESSEVNAIGRCRIGGLQAFGNTTGFDRYRLILHSATELVAIEETYLGGRPVTVEASGMVSSPPYAKAGDDSYINWQTRSGVGITTAWPELMAAFPTIWTSAHLAKGIAQSQIKYVSPGFTTTKFAKLYQGGPPPAEILGRWARCYDPRDVTQDINDETTWAWTMNGVLGAARIMLSYPNVSVDDFDWMSIATEADRADALVNTLTGTEPRSQISGVWLSESKRGDTMKDVLDSIGAEILMTEAELIQIRLIDEDPEAEIAFNTRHMIEWDWKSGPEAVERPNVCRVKYYSPERNYEMAEIDLSDAAWAKVDSEITAYGEKPLDVELNFCPSASQAQRTARRMFLLARGDTGRIVTNMAGMAAWGMINAQIEFPDLNESPDCRISPPRCDDQVGTVEIPYIVWPEELIDTPWNAATMEQPAPDPIPDLEYQAELDTPAAPAAASIVQYEDDSYEVRVKFTGVTGGTTAEAVYRDYSGGLPEAYSSMTEYHVSGPNWYGWATDDVSGGQVDFKARFSNANDEFSHFSDLLTVDPLAVDNTKPAKPTLNVVKTDGQVGGEDWKFDWDVSVTDMHVAKLVITGGTNTNPEGRPEVVVSGHAERSDGQTFTLNATAYTSDGTASDTATYSFTTPS